MRVVFGSRRRRVRRRRICPSRLRRLFSGGVRPGADACTDCVARADRVARADAVAYVFTELRADRVGWSDIRAERLPDSVAFFYADPLANAIAYVFAELLADVAPELRADVFAEPSADVGSDHDTCPEQRADRLLRLAGNFEVRG